MNWKPDDKKFRELILYISQKCSSHPMFGAIKLNKILYYSDFLAYAQLGNPITGHEYQRLRKGPAPVRLLPIRKQMIADGVLGLQPVFLKSGFTQQRTINLRQPNLKLFSGDEIAIVDRVISVLEPLDAETTSEFSHQMIGWIAAKDGETIPYCSVFISNAPLTDIEAQRGREIARRFASTTKNQKAARL